MKISAHLQGLRTNEVLYSHVLKEAATLPLAARTYLFVLQSGVASRLKEAYLREREAGTVVEVYGDELKNQLLSLVKES